MAGTQTYSFLNVQAAITGAGGTISLGQGAAVADEGITVETNTDSASATIGADGNGMTSLHADNSATVTVRLLKTSPVNALLMAMYNFQRGNPSLAGANVISVQNTASGDNVSCSGVSFKHRPRTAYGKDGDVMEWTFNSIRTDIVLGVY
ncbi:MAG: DUF3277 family protein [Rhodospirillales bacterium]|nr:DUF3277 family protein [Rhodospirillales bacterium]